ncbi:hypothetical protein OXX59_002371 [Metschnikowia pulcherrima]
MSSSLSSVDKVGPPTHFYYDADARKGRRLKKSASEIFTIICAGFALISDGYQNNVMTMMNTVFARLYPKEYTVDMKTSVSNASLVGTIFGQVVIGILADRLNRKQSIVIATCFLVFGTVLCAAAHGTSVNGMLWMLIIFRGVTGFGIGAEYPSCSVSANEAANESFKRRGGVFVMVTNLPLSFGGPFALIIFLIVWQITGLSNGLWRALFAIGAFWPLSVFYFRYKMATSELFKKSAIRKNVPYWLAFKFYWKRLLGTCLCWFLYDFVTFPNGVFSATIISSVLPGEQGKNLEKVAEWNLLLGIIAIPGVVVGAYLCDKLGRRNTLMVGFSGYIVFGLIIGLAFEKISKITALFIIFYGLMMSMGNLGPGDMMGLTSSESFATPIRGTCYGLSAAIGKVGAVVGTKSFTPIQVNLGKKWTFIIAAICGLAGMLVAWFFIPQLKDDDLLEEDVRFKNYLVERGWNGTFGVEEGKVEMTTISDDEAVEQTYDHHHFKK